MSSTAVKSVFDLCCHLFAEQVDHRLQAAYRLTCGMQFHLNIRLEIPQTEMYSVKIKASKKGCCWFYSHMGKIALGVIHFQDP